MKNKQIIVDDVDVGGCEFYIDSKNLEFNCKQTPQSYFCKNQPNCYYKQLKRKEQECEELKKELEAVYDDCKGCPTCNEALYNANLYAKEYRKLKQTLAEIKEITKNMNKECFYNDFSCDGCDMINGCTYKGKLSVLQKIKECEGESNKEDN